MNGLKSFVGLQARIYEFLEQQDETTLQAIVSGAAQLTVLHTGDDTLPSIDSESREETRPAADLPRAPSSDPVQAALDLSKLAAEDKRRFYLNASELTVQGLKKVAKQVGLRGYSGLTRARLITLLAGFNPDQVTEQQAPTQPVRPPDPAFPTGTARPNADVAAITSRLCELESEEEGAQYLHEQHLDRESLLAVAAELQLTRVERLKQTELEKKVLKQAIGARRKFAGLRKW